MPHLTIQIDEHQGPVIELLVGLSHPRTEAIKKAGVAHSIPAPIPIRFLVDTGASSTVVDVTTIAPLSLVATGQIFVCSPTTGSAPVSRLQYDVGMTLYHADNSRFFKNLPVIATDLSDQKIGGLLGRDVLSKCLLVYNGPGEKFALAF